MKSINAPIKTSPSLLCVIDFYGICVFLGSLCGESDNLQSSVHPPGEGGVDTGSAEADG